MKRAKKEPVPAKPLSSPDLGVFMDWQGRTCAVVEDVNGILAFLCMDESGLRVKRMAASSFEQHYKRRLAYTVSRWCDATLEFAKYSGASDEAITIMERFTIISKLTKEKLQMSKSTEQKKDESTCVACEGKGKNTKGEDCKPCKGTGKRKDAAEKKPAEKKPAEKKPAEKKPAAAKTTKAAKKTESKEPKAKRETAASMFKELIMAGKLTDEQIFMKVQQKYGLKDDKKWYTSWYRHDLKRKGMNPPDAIKK